MAYAGFFASAVVTGALLALAARLITDIQHPGVLTAIGVIGGGLQMIVLIAWYLAHTRSTEVHKRPNDAL